MAVCTLMWCSMRFSTLSASITNKCALTGTRTYESWLKTSSQVCAATHTLVFSLFSLRSFNPLWHSSLSLQAWKITSGSSRQTTWIRRMTSTLSCSIPSECVNTHAVQVCVWGSYSWCSFSPHEALPSPKTARKLLSLRAILTWSSARPERWARTTSTVWTGCTNVVSVRSSLNLSSVLIYNCLGVNVHFCPVGNRVRMQEGRRGTLHSHECTNEFRMPSIKTFKRIICCFSGSISVGVFLLLRMFAVFCCVFHHNLISRIELTWIIRQTDACYDPEIKHFEQQPEWRSNVWVNTHLKKKKMNPLR